MAMRGRIVPEIGHKQIRDLIIQSYRLIYRAEPSLPAYSAFLWRSMYHQGHEGHEEKQFKHKDLRVENQKNPGPSSASRSSW